jgi:hypothetical protein
MSTKTKLTQLINALLAGSPSDKYIIRVSNDNIVQIMDNQENLVATANLRADATFVDENGEAVPSGIYSMNDPRFKPADNAETNTAGTKAKADKTRGSSPVASGRASSI